MKKFNMHAPGHRRIPQLLLILFCLLLAGCSSLRLAYQNGDTLLYWWLDRYVDFDASQKPAVRQDIDAFFDWHRHTQLPEYAQLLQTGQRQLQGNPTAAELLADYQVVLGHTRTLLLHALPDLADLARSLQPAQIARMEEKFASNNEEFRSKFIRGGRERQLKLRYDKSLEQLEQWFGSFSHEQEAQIRQASDARPLDNALWLAERQRRQQHILAAVRQIQQNRLSKEASMALLKEQIEDGFARLEQSEHQAFFDAYRDGTVQLVLTVLRSASPAQKAHARRRMQGWIEDFQRLAAAPR